MRKPVHLSEVDFISYLSDEVGAWRRSRLRRHLEGCWICSSRLHETETILCRLAEEVQRWPEGGAEETRLAKTRFRKRILSEEPLREALANPRRWKVAVISSLGAVAAAILLLLAAADPVKNPLNRAQRAEARQAAEAVVRQEFELTGTFGDSRQSLSRIEVVSDHRNGRFAVNWRKRDGSLIYGLWRPSHDRVLAYRSAEQIGVRPARERHTPPSTRAMLPEGAGIEKAVCEWLEFRGFEPIRLAEDGFLTAKLGELGEPTEVQEANGRFIMRWDQAEPYQAASLVLQLNAGTFLPISQTLEADAKPLQLKLKLLSQIPVNGVSLDPQTFEPSPLLVMAELRRPSVPVLFDRFRRRQF